MKKTIVSGYFFAFLLFNACSLQTPMEQGKVYDHVVLKKDTTLSYAIYIPKNKSNDHPLAFIFFDPHGSGVLPVQMYQNLADEFGILLIGNNNSSNGTDMNLIATHFSILLQELKNDLHLEEKNIALWGFSGGAKAAMYNTGLNNTIHYCIYGGSVENIDRDFEILGFNGRQDMNYTDLLGFASTYRSNAKHFQIQFQGKHAWPDTTTAKDGFRWLLLKKMQQKEITTDPAFIASTALVYKSEIEKSIAKNEWVDAFLICNKAIHFLSGLTDTHFFNDKKIFINQQAAFKQQAEALDTTVMKESQIKEEYQQNFSSKDTLYWKKEIDGLWEKTKTDQSGMYDRLLGFLSLASYSYANRAFQGNDIHAIEYILFIYQHSDPTNPEQAFMRARMYVLKSDLVNARIALKEAIQLGIDKNRISGDVLLKNL